MGKLSYPYEKFMVATDSMATSDRSLKERLKGAFMSFHVLQPRDFDDFPELQDRFNRIFKAYRKAEVETGRADASVDQMSMDEAHQLATQIVDLFFSINSEEHGA